MPAYSLPRLAAEPKCRRRLRLFSTIRIVHSGQVNLFVLKYSRRLFINRGADEADFYNAFFGAVTHWPSSNDAVVRRAYEIGVRLGLDALHAAAAISAGAEELVTT